MKVYFVLLLMCGVGFTERLITEDEVGSLIKKFVKGDLTDEEHKTFEDVIAILHRQQRVSAKAIETYGEARTTIDCIICRSVFAAGFDAIKQGDTLEEITDAITILCTTLGIETYAVCRGAVGLNLPVIQYIVENEPAATPQAICGLLLQSSTDPNNSQCPFNDERFEWQVELPPVSEVMPVERNEPPLKVAIMTDFHIDHLYEPYGTADCDEPTCCRKGQRPAARGRTYDEEPLLNRTIVTDGRTVNLDLDMVPSLRQMRSAAESKQSYRRSEPAGYWGDYRDCDTPLWAFDDAIDRIAETQRFAPSHVTGEKVNTTWLYEALASKWSYYLPLDSLETFKATGEYSILLRPGLRVIVLNTNIAYRFNWWLVYDPLDSKKHLDWFVQELHKAELAGESVHILSHIPPGVHDLTYTWTREYNRIIDRFSHIIKAEFNGHTHSDEFKLFYDSMGAPTHVAWGAGSVTTYSFYNLNYKIATFDGEKYEPQSMVNYVYNLTEANLTPNRRPHWFQLYDMKNSFNLPDLTPESISQLIYRMVTTDKQFLDLYSAFFPKLSDNRMSWCNTECKLDNLCKVVVTVLWERGLCEHLRELYFR